MNSYKQLLEVYIAGLSSLYELNEITSIYHLALEKISNKSILSFKMNPHETLDNEVSKDLLVMLEELKQGKPIQYVLKEADFYGLKLMVDEHVLIPRVETEELVDLIIKEHKQDHDLQIIDIGTGSGCIPIALAKHLPKATLNSVDVSAEAIKLAKLNAINNKVRINFREIDILEWELVFNEEQFDIIVSNPPYIRELEKQEMHTNVLSYEPHLALFVADHTPLLFYSAIADFAKKHLKSTGKLYFEINQYLADETADLLYKKGFSNVIVLNDLNQVPRMIIAKK